MASTWITLSRTDLSKKLTGPEIEALDTYHICPGQKPPINEVMTGVTAEVRGYIQGCDKNSLNDDATTIPTELEEAALAVVRHRLANRFPDCGIIITDDRHREYEDALRLLRDVAACRFGRFIGADSDCEVATAETTSGVFTGTNAAACIGGDKLIEF